MTIDNKVQEEKHITVLCNVYGEVQFYYREKVSNWSDFHKCSYEDKCKLYCYRKNEPSNST